MKKFIVSLLLTCLSCSTVFGVETENVEGTSFSDVSEESWYYSSVMNLANKGYINGYEDGTFAPNKTITAGEFYTIFLNIFGEEYTNDGEYWYDSVGLYYNNVILEHKDKDIPYVDMGELLTRGDLAIQLNELTYGMPIVNSEVSFNDIPLVKDTVEYNGIEFYGTDLYTATMLMGEIGYMVGDENGNFNPGDYITRAEATVVLNKYSDFMDYLNDLIDSPPEDLDEIHNLVVGSVELDTYYGDDYVIERVYEKSEVLELKSEYTTMESMYEALETGEIWCLHSDEYMPYVGVVDVAYEQKISLVDDVYKYTGAFQRVGEGYTWNIKVLAEDNSGNELFSDTIAIESKTSYSSDYAEVSYEDGIYFVESIIEGMTEEEYERLKIIYYVTDTDGNAVKFAFIDNSMVDINYTTGTETAYNEVNLATYTGDFTPSTYMSESLGNHECFPYYTYWYDID